MPPRTKKAAPLSTFEVGHKKRRKVSSPDENTLQDVVKALGTLTTALATTITRVDTLTSFGVP